MREVKRLIQVLGVTLALSSGGTAWAYTIDDTYWGATDHGYGDIISASTAADRNYFDILGMDVSFVAGVMNVKVYTGFFEIDSGASLPGAPGYGTVFGDLFISTDGWSPHVAPGDGSTDNTVHNKYDNAGNGEGWEFVFDTSANQLYGSGFSIIQSQNAPPVTTRTDLNFIVREGQEVLRGSGGNAISGGSVDLSHVATGLFSTAPDPFAYYLEYAFPLDVLGLRAGDEIGLKWGMSCANDTTEGMVAVPTPLPGSVLLLGTGLLGLGSRRRIHTAMSYLGCSQSKRRAS